MPDVEAELSRFAMSGDPKDMKCDKGHYPQLMTGKSHLLGILPVIRVNININIDININEVMMRVHHGCNRTGPEARKVS